MAPAMPPTTTVCSRRLVPCLCLGLLTLAAAASAQRADSFCQLQKVEVQRLSNALRITLTADGLQQLTIDEMNAWTNESGYWQLAGRDHLTFTLRNVRGGAAPIVPVGQYPVSHLEFSLAAGSKQGIGLDCTLVLYKPAYLSCYSGQDGDWDMSQWFSQWPQVLITRTAKQDQVVLTVLTDRVGEAELPRPAGGTPRTQLQVLGTGAALTVRALNADVHALFAAIARQSRAELYVDDQVQHSISASFDNVSLAQLLRALSTAYGLVVSKLEDTYYVAPCDPEAASTAWGATLKSVRLRYLQPAQAQLMLPVAALPYLRPNAAANSLVLAGPPALVAHLERDLRALDQPGQLCRLRTWLVSTQGDDSDLRTVLASVIGGTTSLSGDSSGSLTVRVGEVAADQALVELRRLRRKHALRISALPTLLCNSGRAARLFVGEQIYYWRLSSADDQDVELSSVDAGSLLSITPRSSGEWVHARVQVENSLLGDTNDLGPVILKRRVSSALRMHSGDLLVVGGLRQDSADLERRDPARGLWPVDALLKGRLNETQAAEIYVLLQAEALAAAPLTPPVKTGATR